MQFEPSVPNLNYSVTPLSKNTRDADMSIISVLSPKGGCGKTTISTNLARALHDRGQSVLIVDSDPQGSARDWHAFIVYAEKPFGSQVLLGRPMVKADCPNCA